VTGRTRCSLREALPRVAGYRPELLAPLPQSAVARLLGSCDRRRRIGLRDYAIVGLLARLGLRAAEVGGLTLDDIDWRNGCIRVRGKGNRVDMLPLTAEVGQALADYLQRGRRPVPQGCRAVFLRIRPPCGPIDTATVRGTVSRAARRAGLGAMGPHRLRRTAATAMLRGGAGMPQIGEVLRHRSMQVTARYAVVPVDVTRQLAVPWPGGAR
jgi:integrase/recombinase XerD